ncbi:unnamed protein product [Agarophyton chilense]
MQTFTSNPAQIVFQLQRLLDQRATTDTQQWSSERMHPVTMSRGVRMIGVRFCVHTWNEQWTQQTPNVTPDLQVSVAMQLFRSEFLEDKFSAIIFLSELLIPANIIYPAHMRQFADLIDTSCISGYEVCDKFSTLVLKQMLIDHRHQMMPLIAGWMRSECSWRARSAIWALIPLARDAIYENLILEGCSIVLEKTDDCCKLAVASALRALARTSPGPVYDFLNEDHNLCRMSASGLSRACGDQHEWKTYFRQRRKDLQRSRRTTQGRSPRLDLSQAGASTAILPVVGALAPVQSSTALPITGALTAVVTVPAVAASSTSTASVAFGAHQVAVSLPSAIERAQSAMVSDIGTPLMVTSHVTLPTATNRRALPSFSELIRGSRSHPSAISEARDEFDSRQYDEDVNGARRSDSGEAEEGSGGGMENRTRWRQ